MTNTNHCFRNKHFHILLFLKLIAFEIKLLDLNYPVGNITMTEEDIDSFIVLNIFFSSDSNSQTIKASQKGKNKVKGLNLKNASI